MLWSEVCSTAEDVCQHHGAIAHVHASPALPAATLLCLIVCLCGERLPRTHMYLLACLPVERTRSLRPIVLSLWVCLYLSCVAMHVCFCQVSYFVVCFGLCLPIFAFPLLSVHPSEAGLPVGQRFGVKANVWIAIYSFIGNYW